MTTGLTLLLQLMSLVGEYTPRQHYLNFCHATLCVSAVFVVGRCLSVCLSVSLTVTFVYCMQTAEDIVNSQSGSAIILVY